MGDGLPRICHQPYGHHRRQCQICSTSRLASVRSKREEDSNGSHSVHHGVERSQIFTISGGNSINKFVISSQ
jgi:hypothetical protein